MTRPTDTEPPNEQAHHGTTHARKRKFKDTYDPSKEDFPDDPWYALDHDRITTTVRNMCDNLIIPLQRHESVDQGIKDLVKALQAAKQLPRIKNLRLASLGEQGKGKSSLINAVLDRKLLGASGGSVAETAFATTVLYKEGADDHTRRSDVKIQFWDAEETGVRIKEQIDRWTAVYPGSTSDQLQDSGEDDAASDTSDHETPIKDDPDNLQGRKVASKTLQRGAATAKDFFGVIFNTKEDETAKRWLDEILHSPSFRNSDFYQVCHERARKRLLEISSQADTHTSLSEHKDISDKDLTRVRILIKQIWPFVKSVTIATGHVLLRNGLSFIDLPGYGDTSQLRETVINDFRRKADCEIVVAPFSRLQTSTVQERYLGRSIRRNGANKTFLVMNRSDELLNENDVGEMISQMKEEPFLSLTARLTYIESINDDDDQDEDEIKNSLDQIMKEATIAYIERETRLVQTQMAQKGVKVFAVSALSYLLLTNRLWRQVPVLTAEESGIPAFRQFLYSLPAESNHRSYRDHIFHALPAARKRATTVLDKHIEDKGYARMRKDLEIQIPVLEEQLRGLGARQIEMLVAKLWCQSGLEAATSGIRLLARQEWIHARIHHSGFAKMLRENGIPVDGKFCGRNLNDDILGTLKGYIKQWHNKMQPRAEQLSRRLYRPVQDLFTGIERSINRTSAHPALKRDAIEALTDASDETRTAYDIMALELGKSLRENYLWFTTEIDIYCPIAREMNPVYNQALGVVGGRGSYDRQRNKILESILPNAENPDTELFCPLIKNLEMQLMSRQKDVWKVPCDTFITEAIAQLNDFSHIAEQLLMDDAYATEQHKEARKELTRLLVDFDKRLKDLQDHFTHPAEHPPGKKAKRKDGGEELALFYPMGIDLPSLLEE
ncbi:uncharacterized protein K460DRAFT_412323 [Cucurbitaria berberidis CBS 394.84]|uniref:Dynamin N-terminal domain-containing protein n=1 Tax=Cucurbitaria berberidis CBS 394.84 TaxID=1168544 RepID=A0A9P4LCE7_9PLEO|nr:uncharacterized protein K460DRAFT_412323 [Cucurbitaria berberidis CBS 394.84]KAF1850656.1 hypothetical protein K460DRAFT_412323 [Cucurbitaria berberidis CBS 394.84]